jgi:hypothetical protein
MRTKGSAKAKADISEPDAGNFPGPFDENGQLLRSRPCRFTLLVHHQPEAGMAGTGVGGVVHSPGYPVS